MGLGPDLLSFVVHSGASVQPPIYPGLRRTEVRGQIESEHQPAPCDRQRRCLGENEVVNSPSKASVWESWGGVGQRQCRVCSRLFISNI